MIRYIEESEDATMHAWQHEFLRSPFGAPHKAFQRGGGFGDFRRGGPGSRPGGRRGFGEAERGSIKYDILGILWDGPRHGYDLMLTIEEKRGFRPSPGSVYPALQMLEEGDFLTGQEIDGKRVYTITDKGSELLAKHRETTAPESSNEHANAVSLIARGMQTMVGLKLVLKEIARTRNPEMYTQALAIVERARRDLYALLTHE